MKISFSILASALILASAPAFAMSHGGGKMDQAMCNMCFDVGVCFIQHGGEVSRRSANAEAGLMDAHTKLRHTKQEVM